jgi:hypothetical protein
LLAVFLLLTPYDEKGNAKFERLATFALVGVTMTYATFTYQQAEASKKMAEEMAQQRYGIVFPIVDVQEREESATDKIRKGLDIQSGDIPKWQSCTLRNIGLGPAVNVCSFIRTPTDERRQWDFGTLAVNEEARTEQLSIEQKNGRGVLVAYYKDVYGRSFESSREIIINQAVCSYKTGPLKIRNLTEEEYIVAIHG